MGGREESIGDLARSRVGSSVGGKWRLERVLGVGGMASVYAASDVNGNHVAIKMLHPARSALPGLKDKFRREGYAANAVGHPGVVRALDEGEAADGSAFLVMELVDGETLEAHWIRRGRRLQAGEVLYIADRVLDILEAAHAVGVWHRDVKPENVMLTRDGVVKLLDFGLANLPDAPRSRHERINPERSRTERPSSDRPSSERSGLERPSSERSGLERPSSERSGSERSRTERPSSDRPSSERSGLERPSSDRPSSERPSSDRPSSERSGLERPSSERSGLERPSSERSGTERPSSERTSLTMLIMGTPAFMAPEQVRAADGEIDGRADLWSLGATMFLLLVGKHVHHASSLQEQVTAAATRDAPSLRESLPFAAPGLVELIDRALAFRLEDRWQSTSDMRVALRKAAAEQGELVDKWDIELPPACISTRPLPLSIKPCDLNGIVDPRTPTLATFSLLAAKGRGVAFLQSKRGFLSAAALAAGLVFASLSFWSGSHAPSSPLLGTSLRPTEALALPTPGAPPEPSPPSAPRVLSDVVSLAAASALPKAPAPSATTPAPDVAPPASAAKGGAEASE